MSEHKFSQNCVAKVLMAGSTRTIIFAGSDVPASLGGVMPDDAAAGVSYACRFLELNKRERDDFKSYLLSQGFN